MRALFILAFILASLTSKSASADTVTLKNGDHLTGTITAMNNQQVTLRTDAAGTINIKWPTLQGISSDQPLYVATPQGQTVTGNVTLDEPDLVVHTTSGDVRVPVPALTVVRTAQQQQAYEKSLHPSLAMDWTAGANIGFALARGNSDTTNLNIGFAADRKTLSDEIKLSASSIYARSGTTTTGSPGGVTASEILGAAAYYKNITKKLFAFGSADYTHDALQGLGLRSIYSAGLGWHVISNPTTTLDALLGPSYTRETYTSPSGVTPRLAVSRNLAAITAGENFMHKFSSNTALTENFNFYPDLSNLGQYRSALDAAVVTKIKEWLGWQASLSDRYVTNPPIPGTKSNDVILSTGLNITLVR